MHAKLTKKVDCTRLCHNNLVKFGTMNNQAYDQEDLVIRQSSIKAILPVEKVKNTFF